MITKTKLNILVLLLSCFSSIGQSSNLTISGLHSMLQNNSKVKIIAVCKPEDFAEGHILNSVQIWRSDYEDHQADFGGLMASKDSIAALLGQLGISPNDSIVLYDHSGGCDAARFWWILDFYGHKKAQVLNGGFVAWNTRKYEIFSDMSEINSVKYAFQTINDSTRYVDLDKLIEAKKRNAIILDVRTKQEFTGEMIKDGAYRAGRIPGALFFPWTDAINAKGDKSLKSSKALQNQFSSMGVTKDREIVVYCQSGVRSAHTTFVLTEILGYTNVKNFDGSWIEYSYNKKLPLEKGDVIKSAKKDLDEEPWALRMVILALILLALWAVYFYRRRRKNQ